MMFYSVDAVEGKTVRLVDDTGATHTEDLSELPEGIQAGDILVWKDEQFFSVPEEAARRRKYASELLQRILNSGK